LDCKTWAGESQWLYKKHGDKDYEKNRWDPDYKLNMKLVDKVFNIYFNKNKKIWVEKTPHLFVEQRCFRIIFLN